MAPAPSMSLLFHHKPKKDISNRPSPTPSQSQSQTQSQSQSQSSTPRPRPPRPKEEPDDDVHKLPPGPFQEFRLMSSALNGWKYDVMKFDSRRSIDISTWQTPIKLNRKDPRRDDPAGGAMGARPPEAVGPMLGPDGKPVIGADGRIVMVDADGRPIHAGESGAGRGGDAGKGKGAANGRKKMQKKTRQVFLVPEATRQLRKEERYPWVIEDSSQKEVWLGKLEDISKAETHAFFMPAANDVFKFVPANRWYKFQKKPNYHIPNLEEAESIMAKIQKNKDPERWLLHKRNGQGPSTATSAIFKAEAEGRVLSDGNSLVHDASQSLAPGGRRLRAVDNGMGGLFGDDDDDEESKRKREREFGGEGDLEEQVYEEDFADDDEKIEDDGDDEETKELEERLKKEYQSANKTREGYVDESDEEDETKLTKDGKAMKKLIRNLEKNTAYDSDEERNPYASSDEEEEEEEPPAPPEPAIQPDETKSRSGSQAPAKNPQPNPRPPGAEPRPDPPSPSLGGHSIVAKRATSPKAPKLKANGSSRSASPLAGGQATSPNRGTTSANGSRATSPVSGLGGSRAGSPIAQNTAAMGAKANNNNKRKAEDSAGGGAPPGGAPGNAAPKLKKRKATLSGPAAPAGELEDRMVIEWLRNAPSASTRDCIQHFTPYLTDEAKKSKFTALVKEVAQLKGGVLVLRNAYRRGGSSVPSPAAAVEGK